MNELNSILVQVWEALARRAISQVRLRNLLGIIVSFDFLILTDEYSDPIKRDGHLSETDTMSMILSRSGSDFCPGQKVTPKVKSAPPYKVRTSFVSNLTLCHVSDFIPNWLYQFLYLPLNKLHIVVVPSWKIYYIFDKCSLYISISIKNAFNFLKSALSHGREVASQSSE